MALLCKDISHWLRANLESALYKYIPSGIFPDIDPMYEVEIIPHHMDRHEMVPMKKGSTMVLDKSKYYQQ